MKSFIITFMALFACCAAQERHSLEYYAAAVEIIRTDSVLSKTFSLQKYHNNVFYIEVSDSTVPYLPKLYQQHTNIQISSRFLEDFGISSNDIIDLDTAQLGYKSVSKIKGNFLPELGDLSHPGRPFIKIFFSELYTKKDNPNIIVVIADAFLIPDTYEKSPYIKLSSRLSGVTYIIEFDTNGELLNVVQSPFIK